MGNTQLDMKGNQFGLENPELGIHLVLQIGEPLYLDPKSETTYIYTLYYSLTFRV